MVKETTYEISKAKVDANRAYHFVPKKVHGGGNDQTHQTSCCGYAIRFLLHRRQMTYAEFGKLYNGTTGQNMNHFINRVSKDRFFAEDVEKMCRLLKVPHDYFVAMCDEIEQLMQAEGK